MRVLALTPNLYGVSPGQRSSIELWDKVLEPAGITMDHSPFETAELREVIYGPGRHGAKAVELARAYVRRVLSVRSVDDYDAVLVYREAALVGPELIERWVARKGKPIIYQLDDPLYVPYRSPFSGWFSYLKFFGKVGRIIGLSSVVIVNSSHHREYAARHNRNVWQIPSVVDADVYQPAERRASNGSVCLGWTGSASTASNLAVISTPVQEVARRADVRLHLIGVAESPFPAVPTTVRPWRADTEVEELRNLDVGLLPLPLNEWNKRKFYLKLVQYMALGIPAVCTPLGSNPEVVEQGRTGFLAGTDKEWIESLERLATDADLRSERGDRAAEVAHARYTLQANADKIVAAFRSAVG
jgi:glycosyltransferase involved in cell wall biosynthesis